MAGLPLVIEVPWDPILTADNELRRLHWSGRAERMKAARTRAYQAWRDAGEPRFEGKVRLSFIIRRARSADTSNLLGGLKPVLDGLCVGLEWRVKNQVVRREPGMLPDDSPKYLEIGSVRQETGSQWKGREMILVTVEAA